MSKPWHINNKNKIQFSEKDKEKSVRDNAEWKARFLEDDVAAVVRDAPAGDEAVGRTSISTSSVSTSVVVIRPASGYIS